ncbi:FecR family protein [Mucilaginibacter rubeus]|uniref:FecR family protein n=1 Tax=Mucilaginibacter rubeus TaxID=2027860 RepID=A0AAE6JCR0_9SPHI|nr:MULTISPECIES: FecR family protein [Mucilaginibacter]QEM03267.1 FecR family protein [Mucilaginibacter rubeus]QEM15885.1 FecR family protein [Mucilaginibacter gossypii]QTE41374.1 FecR family protein [Mucilaginibacter rubeus]QTE47978.1 FecR family protein [Mucilaginibacter rubeus]QTE59371.1 FecR family protein [Mucilaginibacter rubeus]
MGNDKFIELVGKKLSNEISSDENTELQLCLANDASLREQYEALSAYWKHSDTVYADNALAFQKIKSKIKAQEVTESSTTITPVKNGVIYYLWRVAAAVVLMAGCSYLFYSKTVTLGHGIANTTSAAWQNKNTSARDKSTIVLTDGTRITLNSQSSLRYPTNFTGKTREVYLSGEAFFDVHKDHEHPFIIHTEKMNIKVLGTAFNVKSYPDDPLSETTLIRGAIEVTLDDRPSDRIILKPSEKLIVKKGSFTTVRKNQAKLSPPTDSSAGTQYVLTSFTRLRQDDSAILETSWTQNKLIFRDESFADLAMRMERWYGVEIKFKNDEMKKYRFSGTYEKESITQALDALRITEDFHYKIKNAAIYIY